MVNGSFSMSRILFISAQAPTNQYPQAGQRIAFTHLAEYAIASEVVDIVVIANKVELDAAKDLVANFGSNLYTYPLHQFDKITNCLTHYQVPLKFASRLINTVERSIQKLLMTNIYDTIHFECSHAAIYFEIIEKYINPNQTKTVISLRDVWTQVFLRQSVSNFFYGIEVARTFHYERQLYSRIGELWVSSTKDRDLLTSLFSIPSERITIKPHQASCFVYRVQRCLEKIEKKSLLFWGAIGRPENEQAILTFVEQCFKKLVQHDRDFKLYIVGSNPSQKVLALACKQIIVTGFVEDPTEFFEKAEIGIVPLFKGGGIKLKTLEMLEAGLPVIATTVGAEGIVDRRKKLVVSDNFEEWFDLIRVMIR
ncbi:glycosyltransferase [Chroococcidiopsis sp. FACHB-1243]|uniref:glycosyltransferase n=1 Tax=Chroococcidiopsis sp. [FACHB-1243] TaxID=2692781 RepID=UPI001784412F|nr:glycosyltransferase [Chroococcidiopsis sp. [FACHB-1243]]MBD2306415.1 glycosyltransferase [Chroococcidiopsis sp. [FACHB-1243]]